MEAHAGGISLKILACEKIVPHEPRLQASSSSILRIQNRPIDQKVVFLLTNLNPDSVIKNSIFRSIQEQTNLRLQFEQSTSEGGLFRLVSKSGFRLCILFGELLVSDQ